jgi:hypothetical protein
MIYLFVLKNKMRKIIQISDEFFWGYNMIIELDNYSSFEELSILLKNELIVFLRSNNLLNLLDMAKKLELHQHNYHSYDELYSNDYDIIYFCGSCCR